MRDRTVNLKAYPAALPQGRELMPMEDDGLTVSPAGKPRFIRTLHALQPGGFFFLCHSGCRVEG